MLKPAYPDFIIGVDLGFKGAFAVIGVDGRQPRLLKDMPTKKIKVGSKTRSKLELKDLKDVLQMVRKFYKNFVLVIEKTSPIGSRRVTSQANWNLGYAEGALTGLCLGMKIPYYFARPKAWQQHFNITGKHRGEEAPSYAVAKDRFPNEELATKRGAILDGRSDALLIGLYALEALVAGGTLDSL